MVCNVLEARNMVLKAEMMIHTYLWPLAKLLR